MLQFTVQFVEPFLGALNTVDAQSYRSAAIEYIKRCWGPAVRNARKRAEKTGEIIDASTNIWYSERITVRVERGERSRTFTFKPELMEIE